VVLVSVARTQTIQIRKFLRELEHDALLLDQKLNASYGKLGGKAIKDDLKNLVWCDDDQIGDVFKDDTPANQEEVRNEVLDNTIGDDLQMNPESIITSSSRDAGSGNISRRSSSISARSSNITNITNSSSKSTIEANSGSGFQPLDTMIDDTETEVVPHVLSEQEIMHKYWRISMNVRLASVALQRWMSSIIGLITTWSAIRLVYWLSHTPTWSGVLMFIIPLLLLPLLASSYAEVNYEGAKIIQSILPTPERVYAFQYLYGHTIQMTVYGHPITYGTIGTVVAGILAAFASKILLQEISIL